MAFPSDSVPLDTSPTFATDELRVDTDLKLSYDDFKLFVEKFYENEEISAIDQLKAKVPYPTPHELALFAFKAYADNQCAKPKPPVGWKLLTTATNCKNGYFGTAYWHPKYQQIVIAHRGTDTNNLVELIKDIYTDYLGVLFDNYVQQMSSASTFANKVVAVLQEIEQEKKVIFEVFFTGHSLGGWLAQITAFTTEYLKVKESHEVQEGWLAQIIAFFTRRFKRKIGIFDNTLKAEQDKPSTSSTVQDSHDVTHSYHPHTVVFDSPGCNGMLSKMADRYDVRYNGRLIDPKHLDITSYLSAPNIINTCKLHVGALYRIFTDLPKTSRNEKHTPLYNLETHRMKKIVEAFDPEEPKGEDNKGEPIIGEVVDWPVSAGLQCGTELNEVFKSVKYLNSFHPEEKVEGNRPFRYETRAYDKFTKSLSIFNKDQRKFLECYLCFLKLKKLFKFNGVFSVMDDAEAEKEAEEKLHDFKIDNEKIQCPDAMIPYVKRLVRFFPQITKDINNKLSSSEIINEVCQKETRRYEQEIPSNALDFKSGVLGLKEFLTSDQQIWQLRMTDGDSWRGINKVYRVLKKTSSMPNYSNKGHYTILELKWLLTINRVINLIELLQSIQTPHLLLIDCETIEKVDDELQDMFKELFNILENKKDMKVILTTQSEGDIPDFREQITTETLGKRFIKTDKQLTWSDLADTSMKQLLKKKVIFQGREVALKEVISDISIINSFPLAGLLHVEKLSIGEDPVPSASGGYNEMCNIGRTFNHSIVIRQDIFSDAIKGEFCDLLASNKQEFEHLCQNNTENKTVHWLEKDQSGELIWQQSEGNLKSLRKYIDNQKSHSYILSDLEKLLQQGKHQRVMIIADKPGMGKTTVLTHLSKLIKENFPYHWLVRIDVNKYTDQWEAQQGQEMDEDHVLEFVSKEVLKPKSDLEKLLFKKCLEGNQNSKVVLMVEGFDKISPDYKETVIRMLQILKETSLEQLWVTTRPHLKEELEDKLQQLSYTLQHFPEDKQVEFLKNFWSEKLNLGVRNQHRLQIYAAALIGKFAQSISDKNKEFTGIPSQINLLAEEFERDFLSFYRSQKSEPELPHKRKFLGLYGQSIRRKYDIYNKEESAKPASELHEIERDKRNLFYIKFEHQRLAFQTLFKENQLTFLQNDYHLPFSDEELASIGIVQRNSEGKLQFIQRTSAEYLVAEFLRQDVEKDAKPNEQVQELLLNIVLLKENCQVIRGFLDEFLEGSKPSNEALKEYGEKLNKQLKEREGNGPLESVTTALHTAAKEDNASIIGFLLESLKSGEDLSTVTKMLSATDRQGRNALHKAAENDSVQALKKIWEWAATVTIGPEGAKRGHLEASVTTRASAEEEKQLQVQIKNQLLVAKDKFGNTAWHTAAQRGSVQALETLWTWAKEAELNTKELLFAQNKENNTAWQLAAQSGHLEILQKLGVWAKQAKLNSHELKDQILLAIDAYGYTVWHRAAESGNLEVLETLLILCNVSELEPGEMLLAVDKEGNTAWQVAIRKCHFEVLNKLWEWVNKKLPENVLMDKLLLATDQYGNTAWHRAAERGNLEALEPLWNWAKEAKVDTGKLNKNLFLAQDERGETDWHLTADRDHFEVLKKMWVWARDTQKNPNYLVKELLQTKDKYGYTVWHRAAQRGRLKALEMLWCYDKEVERDTDE